jgi:class 3 adenylate cyclase/tetratricopeptide (TPR) repeat protein
VQICPNCGEENPPRFRLCGYCGTALAPELPPQEVRKTVSIVFSDLKGSTSLGESLDSESLREVMNRYFDEMRAVLERHGGTIEKFIGDAVMAVFGLPKLHEDDALRAVRAAADMREALARVNDELERVWGVRLTNRTGVNTGEVVAGDPTTGQRLVTGDAVNVAARLEQAAPANDVLLGDLTYRLVRDAVEVEEVEPLELKGKAERVPAYRLISVLDRTEGVSRHPDAPLVGREDELAVLDAAYRDAVTERSCRLVTVVANAGVGKSRLTEEFLRSVAGEAEVLRGRCLSYGDGVTFWPLAEAIRQAAGIRDDDAPDAAVAKLTALADGDHEIVERVASAMDLSTTGFAIDEIFWGTRKLFELLGRRKPLVVLFDDIHWAAPTFLDLVERLLGSVVDAPVLLLCPARHELLEARPDWAEREGARRIALEPLGEDHTERIVETLLGGAGVDEDARRRIVAAAEGNPLFVEQLVSMLVESQLLRFEDGRWTASSDLAELAVPPSIQALLASRLDRLDADQRAVVDPASVIGLVFWREAVQELAPDAIRDRVTAHLVELTRKQLVRPAHAGADDDERFRFDHVMIREAAYGSLLKRARATFHERFADWAGRVNRERRRETEYEEILGYHLEQAYHYLSELGPLDDHGRQLGVGAAERLASAGRRAFGRGDVRAAVNLLGRAVALLPEGDAARLELLPDLAEATVEIGDFASAEAYLDEAVRGGEGAGAHGLVAHARIGRLLAHLYAGGESDNWSEQVLREMPQTIDTFEAQADHSGLAKAYTLLGTVHVTRCRFGDFLESAELKIRHADLAGDRRQRARGVVGYAIAALYGPMPVPEALRRCQEVFTLAEGDKRSVGLVTCYFANLQAMHGNFDEARSLYGVGRGLIEEVGATVSAAATALQSGVIELLAEDAQAAERELRRAYDQLTGMGETYFAPSVAALLAHALTRMGRDAEAVELTVVVEELAGPDDVNTQAQWRLARAKAFAHQGRPDEAVSLARAGVELLERTDAPIWQADSLVDLAEVLVAGGGVEEARARLTEALRLYEAKGHLASLARAQAIAIELEQTATPA